jgi:DNA (cytosine-5)-methyltransferase 1
MSKKIKKYSEFKEKISIDTLKDTTENSAYLTHYLHNRKNGVSKYYLPQAEEYFSSVVSEPLQEYLALNFKFDVPFPEPKNPKFTFIDLFAGIGGFRIAMQDLFGKCVFSSEIDKYAKKTYELNFGKVPFGDITKISEKDIPEHDVLCAGFPCQAFSIAGKRKGFEETRGTLFFEIARIIKEKKPKAFFLENVKGLRNHDKGKTLKTILEVLRDDLNYYVPEPEIMNAKDFGVPQNRERIYIVGFRKDLNINDFKYPEPTIQNVKFADIKENNEVSVKYYLSEQYQKTLINHRQRHSDKGNGFGYEIIADDQCSNAIVVGGMGRERNIVIDCRLKDFTPVTNIKGKVNKDFWRRMTPREWARLQGFPEKFIINVADVQAYKQFGNSVAIPAIYETAKIIIDKLLNNAKRK